MDCYGTNHLAAAVTFSSMVYIVPLELKLTHSGHTRTAFTNDLNSALLITSIQSWKNVTR